MSTHSLTPEQRLAIATRDVSIALSAGAGCGKTHVLTERFISHLDFVAFPKDGVHAAELRQLVAITFTDAAAREMRSRIRDTCHERLRTAAGEDEQSHWQRVLREIDTARISTIHAFCASLLRAHAAEAGLDPTFGVLDQGDADVLQYNVIDDVLREQLAALEGDTLDLASAFGLSRLKQQIATLLNERHHDYFQTWQTASADQLVNRWQDWHAREAFPHALREIAASASVAGILEMVNGISPKKPAFCDARDGLLYLLPKLITAELSEDDLGTLRELARVQGICSAKDWPATDAFHQYRDACKELRDMIDEHRPRPFDRETARQSAELGLALLRLTAKVVGTYNDRKTALGQLDFDDLLSKAYALLTNPPNAAIRERVSSDLQLLLVDEFQDTDQLQVDLVIALCGPSFDSGRLFFVGDFKQSIYRFRGAAPKVFGDLRNQVAEHGRLPLNVNFRSQPAVLDFINALFCREFDRAGQRYEPLRPSRSQTTTPPAVEFLWTITPDKSTRIKGLAEAARREEARAIARRLRAMMDSTDAERPIVDQHTREPRPLRLGDVAILFRALSDVHVYEEALREYELPYYLVGGHAFYAQQEVYDVLNLLRAVASTADELSLAGVLRSPFFSLADETLFWLVDTAGSLNDGLDGPPPAQLSAEENAKVAAAADTIHALRGMKEHVPIATLLGEALERTGYDAVLLAEFLGERKLANLHKLMERARAADSGVTDLDGFITQLAQFIARQPKEALAATLPESADVIRLMTIHHAKGLEFPLVVVPDLDRPPHIGTPCAALHRELGPLVPLPVDDDRKVTIGMSLFGIIDRSEELEERTRLLYVACTRAADYLILSSSLAAYDQSKSDWMKLLAERFDMASGKLLGNLPPTYAEPGVRITVDPQTDHKPVGKQRGADLLRLLDEARQVAADGGGLFPCEAEPIAVDVAARRQFSFSQLTGRLIPLDLSTTLPRDESRGNAEPAADARGLGILVHEVLTRIDLTGRHDPSDWCRYLASQHVADNDVIAAERAAEMLERFVASPRAKQLAEATTLHREVEFLLTWPSNANGRYLHGFIDCLYQDVQGGWHVIDYKTNNLVAERVSHVAVRYELQLYVYALATERVLGQSPVELVAHFLQPGVEHVFPWNAAARRRAVELIDEAIAQFAS